MAITSALCTSFKQEILVAGHDFTTTTGDVFKLVLIKATPTGTYGAASTNYTDITGNSDEASGSVYTTGGETITSVTPTTSGTTAYCDFSPDITLSSETISADGCMIINSTASGAAISTHDFGGTKTSSGGDFVITFPTADSSTAIIRLA